MIKSQWIPRTVSIDNIAECMDVVHIIARNVLPLAVKKHCAREGLERLKDVSMPSEAMTVDELIRCLSELYHVAYLPPNLTEIIDCTISLLRWWHRNGEILSVSDIKYTYRNLSIGIRVSSYLRATTETCIEEVKRVRDAAAETQLRAFVEEHS